MGLITCSKCKKIYDYEKYSGICPKCARYNSENSASEEHQELHDRYDGGYSHTAQDSHHSYHQKYDENPDPHGNGTEAWKDTMETVQKNLKDAAETVGKTITSQVQGAVGNQQEKKRNKRLKVLIGVLIFVFVVNFVLPLLFILFSAVFIGF
ncbi:MAG: hypothetical protein J6J44_14475 [Lachnospiraceae bacterium]|nr:hypothetical protein [Lachnospiraceae bacterium]MBP3595719.1 hypothetical protein [Lachnospiraceae bacterium]